VIVFGLKSVEELLHSPNGTRTHVVHISLNVCQTKLGTIVIIIQTVNILHRDSADTVATEKVK
jgi:hypothetical protein